MAEMKFVCEVDIHKLYIELYYKLVVKISPLCLLLMFGWKSVRPIQPISKEEFARQPLIKRYKFVGRISFTTSSYRTRRVVSKNVTLSATHAFMVEAIADFDHWDVSTSRENESLSHNPICEWGRENEQGIS